MASDYTLMKSRGFFFNNPNFGVEKEYTLWIKYSSLLRVLNLFNKAMLNIIKGEYNLKITL